MKPEMAWIDIESTGLDANNDVPLEIGLMVTDRTGSEIARWSTLIFEKNDEYLAAIRAGKEHEIVGPMHERSGLWADLDKYQNVAWNREKAAKEARAFLRKCGVEKFTLPMCGSSIGSLDRPFAIVHLPVLHEFFHYRNIDVSTVKELCRMHNPELFAKYQPLDAGHRVLDDLEATVHEYQFYLDNFLFI